MRLSHSSTWLSLNVKSHRLSNNVHVFNFRWRIRDEVGGLGSNLHCLASISHASTVCFHQSTCINFHHLLLTSYLHLHLGSTLSLSLSRVCCLCQQRWLLVYMQRINIYWQQLISYWASNSLLVMGLPLSFLGFGLWLACFWWSFLYPCTWSINYTYGANFLTQANVKEIY